MKKINYMKKGLLLAASLAVTFQLSISQDQFKVIKVFGTITFIETGDPLSQGTVFAENEGLEFQTPSSKAAVVNPEKGRMILAQSAGSGTSNFLPAMSNLSTRAGALNNLIDLQKYFEGKLVFIGQTELQVGSSQFPMDDSRFFFIRYQYNDETINKKLAFNGDKLIIDQETLFMVDEEPISREGVDELTLYYRDGNESVKINTFEGVFPASDELKNEVAIILEEFDTLEEDKQIDEVCSYIHEFYGKPVKENVEGFVKDNFH